MTTPMRTNEKAHGSEYLGFAADLAILAELYRTQGNYADAEPLLKRALAIVEKLLGPEHPDVAASLNGLAALYNAQGKYAEAAKMEARAKAIRAKHAEQNPAK